MATAYNFPREHAQFKIKLLIPSTLQSVAKPLRNLSVVEAKPFHRFARNVSVVLNYKISTRES